MFICTDGDCPALLNFYDHMDLNSRVCSILVIRLGASSWNLPVKTARDRTTLLTVKGSEFQVDEVWEYATILD